MSSFLRYAVKRAGYDLMRAGVRDSFRSMAAAQKNASESQMRTLSTHFLEAISGMPGDQVIGYVVAGRTDRRPVTAGNFAEMLEIVHDGALPLVVVEDGREQPLPPHALKALRIAVKARARLDRIAPPLAGRVIDGETQSAVTEPPRLSSETTSAHGSNQGARASQTEFGAGSEQEQARQTVATAWRACGWLAGVPMAILLTVTFLGAVVRLFSGGA